MCCWRRSPSPMLLIGKLFLWLPLRLLCLFVFSIGATRQWPIQRHRMWKGHTCQCLCGLWDVWQCITSYKQIKLKQNYRIDIAEQMHSRAREGINSNRTRTCTTPCTHTHAHIRTQNVQIHAHVRAQHTAHNTLHATYIHARAHEPDVTNVQFWIIKRTIEMYQCINKI